MSFFYRGRSGRVAERSPAMLRLATTTALAAYPAGALLMVLSPESGSPAAVWGDIAGLALIVIALLAVATFAASRQQRIAGEEQNKLDEFELALRLRARGFAYNVFTALVLIGVVYLSIASDVNASGRADLWVPQGYDHWNGVFWGILLYAFVLPTAWLSWTLPAPPPGDEA
ncbi:hypothetical protein L5876_10590 [Hyphobacterium sp. SN044]|uniref:hypothetical protein n=1 Tax=Hyphobacterium sp. SN044 TaxID=2912575 RepID=UPI001F1612FC|nr:hypothetical protein [Hyphobacterium sp. SN044]MCF8880263.1 hypothetical protein [Hyphobacterium sp. SN044]